MIKLNEPKKVVFTCTPEELQEKAEEMLKKESGLDIEIDVDLDDAPEVYFLMFGNEDLRYTDKLEELGYEWESAGIITPIIVEKITGFNSAELISLSEDEIMITVDYEEYKSKANSK